MARPARVYDYWLGGNDNFAADREAAEAAIAMNPLIVAAVRANRQFLGRAVSFLAREVGLRQFLDVGTGIPTASNTHEVTQAEVSRFFGGLELVEPGLVQPQEWRPDGATVNPGHDVSAWCGVARKP